MRNRRRLIAIIASAATLAIVCCCGGLTAFWFDLNESSSNNANGSCLVGVKTADEDLPDFSPFSRTQVGNAAQIVNVGQSMSVPSRGWVIAIATAMQESHLTNLSNLGKRNDHDSLGLFQQRPSQGWGTPAQIMDPQYAAHKFYDKLLTVKNWQNIPVTVAAQAVQRSAYPDAYAKWEPDATQLIGALAADGTSSGAPAGQCPLDGGDQQLDANGVNLPAGFRLPDSTPKPVVTAINWALRQIGTPYSFGGSCSNSHSGSPSMQCDCSSLTQMSYRAGGIAIPRLARQQSKFGTPIYDLHQLLPGDLLFLVGSDGTRADPGHVGMYLGDGTLIQAPHTGTVVKLTALSNWADIIVGVRRVVDQPSARV